MVEISALQKEIEGVAVLDIPEFRVLKMGVEEILNQVGLADHGDMPADKLPLGLARRLAFGRAILHNPKAMILVESFKRCDEETISLLGNIFRQLLGKGVSVLILADDNANLHPVCDTVYLLNHGRSSETYLPGEEE